MTWYTPEPVAADLADDLVLSWTARIEGRHRLVPDGCVDVLWIDGGRLVVCGPETAGWTFSLPPRTAAVGIRFRPGRAGAVLGMDTADARERRIPIEDVLGPARQRRLLEQLDEAGGDRERVAVLEDLVRASQRDTPPADPVATAVAGMLTADPATPVAELAAETGLSQRQLHRRCTAAFGYGPSVLRRILRLQRFLYLARHPAAPTDLAGLAHNAGFTDQSHLYRECRDLGGASPHELVGRPPRRSGAQEGAPPAAALGAGMVPAAVSDPYTTAATATLQNRRHGQREHGDERRYAQARHRADRRALPGAVR
ncbi:helix-turn-helix domain-containing protein [Streptomonospora wellingtoniae]|uniref:Helix-turn-helix domain-containing protein n=1 Tax=Streptomonospora wellingtoniae TaxID=3075544 RepID=A0ABU2KNG2_9ACTN|nr:helix-turn-helix domain-containing protein [Streptomonospora sp. DSM 45055]MDT0300761.1 helix-turn-helix domain-containing protein [Streptomonospora sp. DSM 45055]